MKYTKIVFVLLLGVLMCTISAKAIAKKTPETLSLKNIISANDELMRKQALMSWNNRIRGTSVDYESTYKGYEWLFTPETISFIEKAINEQGLSAGEKNARIFLRDYTVMQHVGREVVSFDDDITNIESETTVFIPWLKKNVPYRELPILIAKENDAAKRSEIRKMVSIVNKEKLNPIYMKRDEKSHKIIEDLGYKSYLDFSIGARQVRDFGEIIRSANDFNERTDKIYKKLLAEFAKEFLNMKVEDMRRSDAQKLFRFDHYIPYFPADLMMSFLKSYIAGIGFDLKTVDGKTILIDDKPHPKKNPRAACYQMTVPSDVRMTIAPQGGISDYTALFHETGHALHFANTTVPEWSFKYVGDNAATEGYAVFFDTLFGNPDFLKLYRDYVALWNRSHKPVPVLTDKDIGKIVRFGVFSDLYFMRRYGGAKLVYEAIYHDGDPKLWKGIYNGQTDDKKEVYKTLFEKAYGFKMEETDAENYLTDIDDFLYAVDYVRAFVLATQLSQRFADLFGKDWYHNKDVGSFLKQKLFYAGSKLSADDVAKVLDYSKIDFMVHEKDILNKLEETEKLMSR